MPNKTITDGGIDGASITLTRSGGTTAVAVMVKAGGQCEEVILTNAQIAAALTAPERTAYAASSLKLYNAALAAAGYA